MRFIKNQEGQALIEFSIIIPVLLLLLLGIAELSMVLNSYLSIENAAREGARIGVVNASDTDIKNRILNTTPTINSNNLNIQITPSENDRSSGDNLTISITYNYHTITPLISALFQNGILLKTQCSMRVE
jgi:Flp pilus assembly protein TadG